MSYTRKKDQNLNWVKCIPSREVVLKVTLPFELTNNNEGRTKHFGKSHSEKKRFLRLLFQLGQIRKPFEVPVCVTVVRILGKNQRLWDSSSVLRGNYKELEDALVGSGWFYDDSPKYILNTYSDQDDSRREEGPAIELTVWKPKEN